MNELDLSLSEEVKEKHKVVLESYNSPTRCYHDMRHLNLMFQGFELMRSWLVENKYTQDDIDLIKDLIIYHDAVYVVGSAYNETNSYGLMHRNLKLEGRTARACSLAIASTSAQCKHCVVSCVEEDMPIIWHEYAIRIASVLCDLDLYVFSLPKTIYNVEADKVRKEYCDVDDKTFFIGNVRFLLGYMEKEYFYNTSFAKVHWEQQARENILNRISFMSSKLVETGQL